MKTRYALVSNSSSSSFICNNRIEIVSEEMWNIISSDSSYTKKQSQNILQKIKAACKRPDVISGEIGISFPCCNGPTYIIRSDDKCYIATSRNHDWQNSEMLDYDLGEDNGNVYSKLNGHYFLDVQEDLLLKYGTIILSEKSKEKYICPKCQKEDTTYHSDECYVDGWRLSKDGKKYCEQHLCELVEKKTNEKSQ